MNWTASAIDLKQSPASKRARVEKYIIRERIKRVAIEKVRERENEGILFFFFHDCCSVRVEGERAQAVRRRNGV